MIRTGWLVRWVDELRIRLNSVQRGSKLTMLDEYQISMSGILRFRQRLTGHGQMLIGHLSNYADVHTNYSSILAELKSELDEILLENITFPVGSGMVWLGLDY